MLALVLTSVVKARLKSFDLRVRQSSRFRWSTNSATPFPFRFLFEERSLVLELSSSRHRKLCSFVILYLEHSRGNARSKYKQWIQIPQSQLSGHARVQHCWKQWPNECNIVVHTWEQKKCWMMLKTMFDGYQTSFNIIQHHSTSYNMVAKRVQHVGFNNVGRCCINMLDPFGRAFTLFFQS